MWSIIILTAGGGGERRETAPVLDGRSETKDRHGILIYYCIPQRHAQRQAIWAVCTLNQQRAHQPAVQEPVVQSKPGTVALSFINRASNYLQNLAPTRESQMRNLDIFWDSLTRTLPVKYYCLL